MENNLTRERVRIEVSDKKIDMEHFHRNVELCYVLQGRAEIQMDDESVVLFEEGVYVINANKKHCIRLSEDGLIVKISISFELMSDILGAIDVRFLCNSNLGNSNQYDELRSKIKKLLTHYVNTNGSVADFGHITLKTICIAGGLFSMFARHGRALTGESPEHAQIVGSV